MNDEPRLAPAFERQLYGTYHGFLAQGASEAAALRLTELTLQYRPDTVEQQRQAQERLAEVLQQAARGPVNRPADA